MNQLHRIDDPLTSTQSACAVVPFLADYQARFVIALRQLRLPSTANEIASKADDTQAGRESIRKRAAELVRSGAIREVGRRTCRVTGASARVFVVAGWTCPTCGHHRSDAWLLRTEPTDCPVCISTQERVGERAAIAEYSGGLSRPAAEHLALSELT